MAGAVFFLVVAVIVVALVALSLISWFWVVGVLAVFILGWLTLGGAIRAAVGRSAGERDLHNPASDVPSTRAASYDPVQRP
jgi:hypothetical protein